jgi:hypothetical protein
VAQRRHFLRAERGQRGKRLLRQRQHPGAEDRLALPQDPVPGAERIRDLQSHAVARPAGPLLRRRRSRSRSRGWRWPSTRPYPATASRPLPSRWVSGRRTARSPYAARGAIPEAAA